MQTPHQTAAEITRRDRDLRAAAEPLVLLGEELFAMGEELRRLAEWIGPSVERRVKNDVTAALAPVDSAAAIHRVNTDENRRYLQQGS